MSYTNPNGQPQGTASSVSNKLREALIGEIIAINGYAEHIANSNMEEVNAVWQKIMEDEKKHYGIFLSLLRKSDPAQYRQYVEHSHLGITSVSPLQTYVPNYSKQIILNNIRDDIKGEFEASILYESLAANLQNAEVKRALNTISDEEKGHSEHLTRLLLMLDKDKYDDLK